MGQRQQGLDGTSWMINTHILKYLGISINKIIIRSYDPSTEIRFLSDSSITTSILFFELQFPGVIHSWDAVFIIVILNDGDQLLDFKARACDDLSKHYLTLDDFEAIVWGLSTIYHFLLFPIATIPATFSFAVLSVSGLRILVGDGLATDFSGSAIPSYLSKTAQEPVVWFYSQDAVLIVLQWFFLISVFLWKISIFLIEFALILVL